MRRWTALLRACPCERRDCPVVDGKDHRKTLNRALPQTGRVAGAVLLQRCCKIMPATMKTKPVMVESGPVKENRLMGEQVNMLEIPAPKWHHRDGGRFVGTCDGVVTKDPETGWVNIGLYRRKSHRKLGRHFSACRPQAIGRLIRE